MRVMFYFLFLILFSACSKSEQKNSAIDALDKHPSISKAEALANVQYQSATFTKIGEPSCGKWIRSIDESAIENSVSAAEIANLGWLMGYLSGRNSLSIPDVLENADGDSIELYITNYCKEHPLDSMATAANTLFLELMNKEAEK